MIEKGTVVAVDQAQKSQDSFYVSAPVLINGNKNIVTVIIHRDVNTQSMYLHGVILEESLLKPRVSETQETSSRKHIGSLTSADIHNILHKAITFKDDTLYSRASNSTLLAPNGKPSNLTPEQYRQVRTPEFKAWFGDWENDPANASKVVDENGEPMVVYHYTEEQFTQFELSRARQTSDVPAFFFTTDPEMGMEYGETEMQVFLNIRNPVDKPSITTDKDGRKLREELIEQGYDGTLVDDSYDDVISIEYAALNPNQIKSATDNTGEFNPDNDDIRFSQTQPVKNPTTTQDADSATTAIETALGKTVANSITIETDSSPEMAGVEGYHNRSTGETVVLLDNIEPMYDADGNLVMTREERAVWVAWHESYHKGTSVAGNVTYRKTLAIARRNPFISALVEKIQLANPDYSLDVATEEALAELSAGLNTDRLDVLAKQYGIATPQYDGIKAIVNKWITEIRNILRRLVGKPLIISDAQIAELVKGVGELAISDALSNSNANTDVETDFNVDQQQELALNNLFSFAGVNSENADKRTLQQAIKLDEKNVSQERIRQSTGWFKGVDGEWRYEIDDSQALLTDKLIDSLNNGESLGDLFTYISHSPLFDAYPHLRNITVRIRDLPEGVRGKYSSDWGVITISNKLNEEQAKSTLMHEIQHSIQDYEGFAVGTNDKVARRLLVSKYGTQGDVEQGINKLERQVSSLTKLNISTLKLTKV